MSRRQSTIDPLHSDTPAPVPLFDPRAQYQRLQAEIDRRIAATMASGAYVNGPEVAELETELGRLAGGRHCVACANGTDALVMALLEDGIGPGDTVFVPAFTYVATAGAVRLAGAIPVFCDVLEATCNLDANDLAHRVDAVRKDGTLRPKAVIPVDLYGLPADYDAIRAVAETHGLTVIADAAQAMGGQRDDTPVGMLAEITTTSFYPTKPLACAGDGGAMFTDDSERAARWCMMRTHGIDASRTATHLGMNNRLDTVQAAILLAKLPALANERAHREGLAKIYDAELADIVQTAPRQRGCESAWALYTIRSERRDAVSKALAEARIGAGVYYGAPLHLHPAFHAFGNGPGSLPLSERLAGQVLSLPLTSDTTPEQIYRVCTVVRAVLSS